MKDIAGALPWRVASEDYEGIVHFVAHLSDDGMQNYQALRDFGVFYFRDKPYALTYASPKKVLTACDVWVPLTPPSAEKRPVTCLACLASPSS